MVWGCMSAQGVGYCCQIRGNMNGALYCQVLQSTLMRLVDYLDLDKNSFISSMTMLHVIHPKMC
jgi:hypothetical protein